MTQTINRPTAYDFGVSSYYEVLNASDNPYTDIDEMQDRKAWYDGLKDTCISEHDLIPLSR